MKTTLAAIVALVLTGWAAQAFAQSPRISTSISTEKHDPAFSLGRDFWFAPGQNYTDQPGKYLRIYITSPNSTTAFVECEGVTKAVPIQSYSIGSYDAPLAWEMMSSGVVENKAIHVWDPTDDICVNLMSHNPYSGDGMYCIPTIGWGTDYVVAAYESLHLKSDTGFVFDLPSEFTITADQDNTSVQITPSTPLRLATVYPDSNAIPKFQKGEMFSVTLNRGQSIQYQAVNATRTTGFDVTGTIIHSSNPVGVVGASMEPQIPAADPFADFVMDMNPPTRTWGETYYTTTTVQPTDMPLHDSCMYLMIASKNNQTIHRSDSASGSHVECVIDSQYHIFWAEAAHANKWYSDAPFLLVQYINSSSFPDNTNGNGDPAEVNIPAKENFSKTVFFNTTTGAGAQAPFEVYANVIVNAKDRNNVTFDGNKITFYPRQIIDSVYEIYVVPNVIQGAHVVKSDSGAGVYLYGYGYDETFAWEGSSGVATFNSSDNAPPLATVSSQCFGSTINLADTGALASKLSEISIDSDVNMSYFPDSNFIAGVGYDTSGYSVTVKDNTKPAILKVTVFDFAGNRTTITSTYTPAIAEIAPYLQNFGPASMSGPPLVIYDTLINNGALPIEISNLSLEFANAGFTIDSIGGSSTVLPGQRRLIPIAFLPIERTAAIDTIIYNDGCFRYTAGLIGSGGGADFYVTDANWGNVPFPPLQPGNWTKMGAVIHNLSKQDTLAVDTAGLTDRVHFVLLPNQHFPVHVSPAGTAGDTASVWYYFEPTAVARDTAIASWACPLVRNSDSSLAVRYDRLMGYGAAPVLTFTGDTIVTIDCPSLNDTVAHLYFLLTNSGGEFGVINKVTVSDPTDVTNLTGHDQHGFSWDPTKMVENIDPGSTDTFTLDFHYKPNANTSVAMNITAFGISGDTLGGGSPTATVDVNYWAGAVSTSAIDFGTVPWLGTKDTQSFTITDTVSSYLTIFDISFVSGGNYDSSYSIVTSHSLPVTLDSGQFITVYVIFDPSVSGDPVQNAILRFVANWCNDQLFPLYAKLSGSGVAEGIAPPALASILQLDDGRSIQIIIPPDWTPPVRLDIYNILGETVYSTSIGGTSTFDLSALAKGVYFYRLRENEISQTGKILLSQ